MALKSLTEILEQAWADKVIEEFQVKCKEARELLLDAGVGYLKKGEYEKAESALTTLVELEQTSSVKNFRSHLFLGICYDQQNRLSNAEVEYNVALNLADNDEDRGNIYGMLGTCLFHQGDRFKDAFHALKKAVELGNEESRARFESLKGYDFDDPKTYTLMGSALKRWGYAEAAEKALRKAAELEKKK